MNKTWCSTLHKSNKVGVIVIDLSEAFNALNQNLLIFTLTAYSFETNALTLI